MNDRPFEEQISILHEKKFNSRCSVLKNFCKNPAKYKTVHSVHKILTHYDL